MGTTAIIGLTGGIACGKSTVAARLRERGAHIVDADVLAREVVEPGQPALTMIVRMFGPEVLTAEGRLDRAKLGAMVFADKTALGRLNAIVHPAVGAATGKALADAQRAGRPWMVYEAALIVENKIHAGMAGVIAVLCPPEVQLARLIARSGLDEAEARRRIAAQTDDESRRAVATWVIENDADVPALMARADDVFDEIVERFGRP